MSASPGLAVTVRMHDCKIKHIRKKGIPSVTNMVKNAIKGISGTGDPKNDMPPGTIPIAVADMRALLGSERKANTKQMPAKTKRRVTFPSAGGNGFELGRGAAYIGLDWGGGGGGGGGGEGRCGTGRGPLTKREA